MIIKMADDRSGSSDPIGNGRVLILLLYVRVDASLLGKATFDCNH
jgi:hypothetical protein